MEKTLTENLETPNSSLVVSYLGIRKAVGLIGIVLPFVLVFGKIILGGSGIEPSISNYYYTIMRDVFVGSLCAIGIFLISYRGYQLIDNVAGKLTAIFAFITAFFPTSPPNPTVGQIFAGNMHIFFSAALFAMLAFFALFLFRKTNPNKPFTPQKKKRNFIYTICGFGMLACILLALSLKLFPSNSSIFNYSPLFWLESVAIILFGISWLVKGEAILKDELDN